MSMNLLRCHRFFCYFWALYLKTMDFKSDPTKFLPHFSASHFCLQIFSTYIIICYIRALATCVSICLRFVFCISLFACLLICHYVSLLVYLFIAVLWTVCPCSIRKPFVFFIYLFLASQNVIILEIFYFWYFHWPS